MKTQIDKITTLHPEGKKGVNISIEKYNIIKDFILNILKNKAEESFENITDQAIQELSDTFEGKIIWYMVTVKLDLEARNLIQRIPKFSPQRLRLVK